MLKSHNKQKTKAFLSLLGGLSFMCFAAIFVKASHASGIVTAFYRMFIGAIALCIPFFYYRWKHKQKFTRKGLILAVLAGLCFGFDMALWSTGVVISNATLPTLMANLAPVWVGIGAMLVFKEKNNYIFWFGLLVAIGGILLLVRNELFNSNGVLNGIFLGLGAGFFYAVFYLVSQSGRKIVDSLSFLFISTVTSAFLLFIFILIIGYNFTGYDLHTRLIFLGFGLGVQVCGWFLISYAQGYLPATIVAPTLLGQPVLTYILAVLLLNEKLTVWHLSGGIIVIAGIYLVNFSRK